MRTVTMIERTHDLEMFIPAFRAGCLVDDQVTGITFIAPLLNRNILQVPVFYGSFLLVLAPLHITQ